MPSPFPGMDPYLEGYLWPDLHQRLAAQYSRQLNRYLRPRYVARLAVAVVEDDPTSDQVGFLYPDVEVVLARRPTALREAKPDLLEADLKQASVYRPPIVPAGLTVPFAGMLETRLVTIEVRDVARNDLITVIEILSPVNKREPGLSAYRAKVRRLHAAGVHVLEIDLLRRGSRSHEEAGLPEVPYLITLLRSAASRIEVWPVRLQEALPVVPVPLLAPDPDVPLDLGAALAAVYDDAAYDLSIDYGQPPPPPPLMGEDEGWLAERLASSRN